MNVMRPRARSSSTERRKEGSEKYLFSKHGILQFSGRMKIKQICLQHKTCLSGMAVNRGTVCDMLSDG